LTPFLRDKVENSQNISLKTKEHILKYLPSTYIIGLIGAVILITYSSTICLPSPYESVPTFDNKMSFPSTTSGVSRNGQELIVKKCAVMDPKTKKVAAQVTIIMPNEPLVDHKTSKEEFKNLLRHSSNPCATFETLFDSAESNKEKLSKVMEKTNTLKQQYLQKIEIQKNVIIKCEKVTGQLQNTIIGYQELDETCQKRMESCENQDNLQKQIIAVQKEIIAELTTELKTIQVSDAAIKEEKNFIQNEKPVRPQQQKSRRGVKTDISSIDPEAEKKTLRQEEDEYNTPPSPEKMRIRER
jgi:hypothetical protein